MADDNGLGLEGLLRVPRKIGVENGFLLTSHSAGARMRRIDSSMLVEFAEIGLTGEESMLLRFAKRYGPLNICDHGLPCEHNRRSFARELDATDCYPLSSPIPGWDQGEPLALWFSFARQAQAILACSAYLHLGERPNREDLTAACGLVPTSLNIETARAMVQGAINTWIHNGGLRPYFLWRRLGCSVVFSTGDNRSVFGALAEQLMLMASRQEGFVICSACGRPYLPVRRPNPRRRKFCRLCGLRAAWRHSKQHLRAANRLK